LTVRAMVLQVAQPIAEPLRHQPALLAPLAYRVVSVR
jgi:hypothetical protein